MEVLLRGIPVVASARCYVPEFIVPGKNGELVEDYDDITEWVTKTISVLQDKDKRTRYRDFNIRLQKQFTSVVAIKKLEKIIQKALARRVRI